MQFSNNQYADVMRQLNRGIAVYIHAMGMTVRTYSTTIMKKMSKCFSEHDGNFANLIAAEQTPGGTRNAEIARDAWDAVVQSMDKRNEGPVATRGICRVVGPEFVEDVLRGTHRDDTTLAVAIKMEPNLRPLPTNVIVNGFRYRPTACVSWGVCDRTDYIDRDDYVHAAGENPPDPFTLEVKMRLGVGAAGNEMDGWVNGGRVAEIDLVCAAPDLGARQRNSPFWTTRGSGRALLAHTLSVIAARKKNGARRFKAVVLHMAQNDNGGFPMKEPAEALGFTQIASTFRRADTNAIVQLDPARHYMVLKDTNGANAKIWPRKVGEAINVDICPTVTGRGTLCK